MSEITSNEAIRYYSRYSYGVDEKRRIQIPSKWRPLEADAEFMLILWEDNGTAGPCLRVYPPAQMTALFNKTGTMSTSDHSAVALRRNIAKNCDSVTLDKAGRLCIPEMFAAKAGIDRQVVLAGVLQWFEIWNPERYEVASRMDEALSPEAVRQI